MSGCRICASPCPRTARELDPAALFDFTPADVWLEVGFGGGEHLAAQAADHPDIGFIGCEPFVDGVAALTTMIDEAGLTNVRLFDDDARTLLPALPDGNPSAACSCCSATRGRNAATTSAASPRPRRWPNWNGSCGREANFGSPPITWTTPPGSWSACCVAAPSSGWPADPATGADRPAGRPPHPLRGQGPGRRQARASICVSAAVGDA